MLSPFSRLSRPTATLKKLELCLECYMGVEKPVCFVPSPREGEVFNVRESSEMTETLGMGQLIERMRRVPRNERVVPGQGLFS